MADERVRGPASYFPSIEKSYGRPIAHWPLLQERKQHRARVAVLKTGHHLGHGHPKALVAYHRAQNEKPKVRGSA